METKRAAIFTCLIGGLSLAMNALFHGWLGSTPIDVPLTAEHICEVENSDPDDLEDVGRYKHPDACAGKADAMNDRPQKNGSIEYTAGYLEGLSVNCFRDNPSEEGAVYFKATPAQEACRLERKAAEDEFRQQNGMAIR